MDLEGSSPEHSRTEGIEPCGPFVRVWLKLRRVPLGTGPCSLALVEPHGVSPHAGDGPSRGSLRTVRANRERPTRGDA